MGLEQDQNIAPHPVKKNNNKSQILQCQDNLSVAKVYRTGLGQSRAATTKERRCLPLPHYIICQIRIEYASAFLGPVLHQDPRERERENDSDPGQPNQLFQD